jgi:hypothetical protein
MPVAASPGPVVLASVTTPASVASSFRSPASRASCMRWSRQPPMTSSASSILQASVPQDQHVGLGSLLPGPSVRRYASASGVTSSLASLASTATALLATSLLASTVMVFFFYAFCMQAFG